MYIKIKMVLRSNPESAGTKADYDFTVAEPWFDHDFVANLM